MGTPCLMEWLTLGKLDHRKEHLHRRALEVAASGVPLNSRSNEVVYRAREKTSRVWSMMLELLVIAWQVLHLYSSTSSNVSSKFDRSYIVISRF
jgi:hypothetical protein